VAEGGLGISVNRNPPRVLTAYRIERKSRNLTETTSHLGERFSNAKEQAKGLGRTAGEKLDKTRHWTVGEVHTAPASETQYGRVEQLTARGHMTK
jgi:hypothetical protein